MLMIQAELEAKDPHGRVVHTVYWLPADAGLKQGCQLTLKDDSRMWTVARLFMTMDSDHLNKKWRVGGLT